MSNNIPVSDKTASMHPQPFSRNDEISLAKVSLKLKRVSDEVIIRCIKLSKKKEDFAAG